MKRHAKKIFLSYVRFSFISIMEWYDFALYGYFSVTIGALFFPSSNLKLSLLASFSVFAIGFLARPLGGMIFGYIGDSRGRHYAMNKAILYTSVATILIALIPDYSQIGALAPCLLVLLRFTQGISLGGQYGNLITITSEGDTRYRGFYIGVVVSVSVIGMMLASLASQLSVSYTPASLQDHAWRFPFLLGGLLLFIQIRHRQESDNMHDLQVTRRYRQNPENPISTIFHHHLKSFFLTVGLVLCVYSMGCLIYIYMATYLVQFLNIPHAKALQINTFVLIINIFTIPVFGLLSDFIDRKKLLLAGFITFLIACYPMMELLWQGYIYTGMALMAVFLGWLFGLVTPVYVELFPHKARATGCTLGTCMGSTFAGFIPLAATSITTLYHHSHLVWLYAGLLVLGITATLLLPNKIPQWQPAAQSQKVANSSA